MVLERGLRQLDGSMFLIATIFILASLLFLQPIAQVNAQANPGDYIVTEGDANVLSRITPGGVRTVIYTFAGGTGPRDVAIVPVSSRPVGGIVMSVNKLAILAPYLALAGLVAVVSAVVVVKKRSKG